MTINAASLRYDPVMSRWLAAVLACASACGSTPPPSSPDYVVGPGSITGESAIAVPEPLLRISLMIRDVEGLYLFDDEQLEAANIVAAWAKTTNLAVEDPVRTREIMRRAANGQDARTQKACGGPLWTLAALERWRDELVAEGRIEASVACLPQCVLMVKVSEGLDAAARDAGRTAMWMAAFDPSKPWREELARRLKELSPQPLLPDAPAKAAGAQPRPAQVDPAFASVDEELLPAVIATRAQACLGDVGAIGLLLETDASGRATRCEGYAHRIVANGPVASCACKAIGDAAIGGGARRLATTVTLPPGASVVRTKAGKLLDAHVQPLLKRDAGTGLYLPIVTDRSVRDWEPPMPWTIAACFTDLAPTAPAIEAQLAILVDGATAAASVGETKMISGALTPAQATCLGEAVARATNVPCPEPGTQALSAVLVVKQREP